LPNSDVSRKNVGGKSKVWRPVFLTMEDRAFVFVKKRNHQIACVILAALLPLIITACSRPVVERIDSADGQTSATRTAESMRVVTDDLERRITIPLNIKRAVSLAPSVTESIFAVGAGDRLVGDTTFCDYPEAAKTIQKVGDTLNPNIETILALKPDVVFVSGASQLETFTKTLDDNGIAVYVMDPLDLDAVYSNLEHLGIIFGTEDTSRALVNSLKDRERRVREALGTFPATDEGSNTYGQPIGTVKVFVQISKEPLFTIGKDAFLNDLILRAAGRSVTADVPSAFPKLSKETAVVLQPEAIIMSDSEDNQGPNDAFKNSPAVKNGRLYMIDADIISRPGPRLIDALEQIAKDLHPEKFK
jgi:iron complex transport system substrate-binding protein